MEFSLEILSYVLTGCLTGVLAGLLGVGGGIIVVPALMLLLPEGDISAEQRMHISVATSLVVMIPTAFSSALKHFQQQNLIPVVFRRLGLGIFFGAIAGVYLAKQLPRQGLQMIFAIFELIIAYEMLRPRAVENKEQGEISAPAAEMVAVGGLIGGLSSLLGIGGGTMTVPYLNWRGVSIRKAIGTSASCGFVIAVTGAAAFAWSGPAQSTPGLYGYIYLPAALSIGLASMITARFGAGMSQTLSVALLRRLFGLLLIAVAVKMLW